MDFPTINFEEIYGNNKKIIDYQKQRYAALVEEFISGFGKKKLRFFSSPGRIEIGGNHTDHNNGKVIAASINLDTIAAVSPVDEKRITIYSEGYENSFEVDLNNLEKQAGETGTTNALIRGIAFKFNELNYNIGGFEAVIKSDVLPGSGLSSSASVEVLIANILNELFNGGRINGVEIARISQFAENEFFGKPCGLMDQMACALGGIIAIDFENPARPVFEKVNFDFANNGYNVIIVNTGGSHADLTDEYSSIPEEMKAVAKYFGKNVCRELSMELILSGIKRLREKTGDRAVLRAIHFLTENQRVEKELSALKENNLKKFFSLVNSSGNSSFKYLQNVYSNVNINEQPLSLALALTENYLEETGDGACRVHGGGFAGTILVFLPFRKTEEYVKLISEVFGNQNVKILSVRNHGSMIL